MLLDYAAIIFAQRQFYGLGIPVYVDQTEIVYGPKTTDAQRIGFFRAFITHSKSDVERG